MPAGLQQCATTHSNPVDDRETRIHAQLCEDTIFAALFGIRNSRDTDDHRWLRVRWKVEGFGVGTEEWSPDHHWRRPG